MVKVTVRVRKPRNIEESRSGVEGQESKSREFKSQRVGESRVKSRESRVQESRVKK